MSAADRVKALKESLKITDDQAAKITVIYDAQVKSWIAFVMQVAT
jgi:protein CpxP